MDRHECGTCGEEFSQIEEFVAHKKSGCQESGYCSSPKRDTVGNATEMATINSKSWSWIFEKFKDFLLTQTKLDLDHMVEKAKNGEKDHLENALQNFVEQYRTKRKFNRLLPPSTKLIYKNILKNCIYEYSGGLVDLKNKPWGNYPRSRDSNPLMVTSTTAAKDKDQDCYCYIKMVYFFQQYCDS